MGTEQTGDAAVTDDKSTSTTSTGTPAGTGTEPSNTDDATTLQGIKALADELGITTGQLKGRLEASRKWEARAKENANAATELANLKKSQMSEQEQAVEAAKAEGRTQALAEVGSRLVAAEFRAAAAGKLADDQVSALLEDLDLTKFLDDKGDVDADRVKARVDALAPAKPDGDDKPKPLIPDLGQGQRPAVKDNPGAGRARLRAAYEAK